jgi:alkylation response protein AidB-like acyl-CoA dehydrogenase
MRLTYTPELEEFRAELSKWLDANRPSKEEIEADPPVSSGHLPDWLRAWIRRQFDAGWLVPSWPPELGGRNASAEEEMVYFEEVTRHGLIRSTNHQGLDIVAPSLRDFATPHQRERYLMPILRGEKSAALGMSEPSAGSDLAGLKTRAVLDGDHFIVNGQKVWTSGAKEADFCICFVRTDPDVPKHKGLSALLIDLDTPGVTVRPLMQASSQEDSDFNEVFFDDARVPCKHLVGELHGGWAVANGSLGHERMLMWILDATENEQRIQQLIQLAIERPGANGACAADDASVRDVIAKLYVDSWALTAIGYRSFAKLRRGRAAPEQSVMKLFGSETGQAIERTFMELAGLPGLKATTKLESFVTVHQLDAPPFARYLGTFAGTISGGTSEIQRNIVAERVLGLPRR